METFNSESHTNPDQQSEATEKEQSTENQSKKNLLEELSEKYEALSIDDFPTELTNLTTHDHWMKMGKEVNLLTEHFEKKCELEKNTAREKFIEQGNSVDDFVYDSPINKEFYSLLKEFKTKRRKLREDEEEKKKENLIIKRDIISQIQEIIRTNDPGKNYQSYINLQKKWYTIGDTPIRDRDSLWQSFKHQCNLFYDLLHFDRKAREKVYTHNYDTKLKIIEKAENLAETEDVLKAGRELNTLHRMWKNDIGPVMKEHRENLWKRFQEASKVIQEKKEEYKKNIFHIEKDNFLKKEEIINKLQSILEYELVTHNDWQKVLSVVNTLKDTFQKTGPVPKKETKNSWKRFRETCAKINQSKNEFYKNKKAESKINIQKKKELIEEVDDILSQTNFKNYLSRMKKIQTEWKESGKVPMSKGKKLWEQFNSKSNEYFHRIKNNISPLSAEEEAILKSKKAYLEEVINEEKPKDLDNFKVFFDTHLNFWNAMGTIPNNVGDKANQEFHDYFISIINSLSFKNENEQTNLLLDVSIEINKSDRNKLEKELFKINTKVEEKKTEMRQLENNLAFFSNSSGSNPIIKEVAKKIQNLSSEIEVETLKLSKIKRALR